MSSPALPLHPLAVGAASASGRAVSPLRLPPLDGSADGLSAPQRRLLFAGILAAHVAGIWGLMQVGAVRDAVRETVPMFVDLIAPEPTPPAPPPRPVPPPPTPPPPTPAPAPVPAPPPRPIKKPPPPRPVIKAAPRPAPAEFVVPPAPPPEPVVAVPAPVAAAPAPVAAPVPAPAPAPPPAAPPQPKEIPASAVQYLEPPVLAYPRLSMRNGESGRVLVRVYIDTAGLPRNVQVSTSSGFARLDDAAVAAVRKARFKPYTENGQAIAGWALIPLKFELER